MLSPHGEPDKVKPPGSPAYLELGPSDLEGG